MRLWYSHLLVWIRLAVQVMVLDTNLVTILWLWSLVQVSGLLVSIKRLGYMKNNSNVGPSVRFMWHTPVNKALWIIKQQFNPWAHFLMKILPSYQIVMPIYCHNNYSPNVDTKSFFIQQNEPDIEKNETYSMPSFKTQISGIWNQGYEVTDWRFRNMFKTKPGLNSSQDYQKRWLARVIMFCVFLL